MPKCLFNRGDTGRRSSHVVRSLSREFEVASTPADECDMVVVLLHQILVKLKELNVKSAVLPMKAKPWESPYLTNTRTIMGTVAGLLVTVALAGGINPHVSLLNKRFFKLTFQLSLWLSAWFAFFALLVIMVMTPSNKRMLRRLVKAAYVGVSVASFFLVIALGTATVAMFKSRYFLVGAALLGLFFFVTPFYFISERIRIKLFQCTGFSLTGNDPQSDQAAYVPATPSSSPRAIHTPSSAGSTGLGNVI